MFFVMEKKTDNGKKPIIIISVMLVLVLIVIIIFVAMLFLGTGNTTSEPEEQNTATTEEPLADVTYEMEQEEMFLKYGNFKNHETALNVIQASMNGESEWDIETEVFLYWFTLVRYGDYSDAYTFIDTDMITQYGIEYSYEQFVMDCEDLCVRGGIDDDLWLRATVVDGSTPTDEPIGNLHMAVITSDAETDGGVALFLPFYITEELKIIPFDITQESAAERYTTTNNDYDNVPSTVSTDEESQNSENTEESESSSENTESTSQENTSINNDVSDIVE